MQKEKFLQIISTFFRYFNQKGAKIGKFSKIVSVKAFFNQSFPMIELKVLPKTKTKTFQRMFFSREYLLIGQSYIN